MYVKIRLTNFEKWLFYSLCLFRICHMSENKKSDGVEPLPPVVTAEMYEEALLKKACGVVLRCEFFVGATPLNAIRAKISGSAGAAAEEMSVEVGDNAVEVQLRRQYDEAFDRAFAGIDEYDFYLKETRDYVKIIRDFKMKHVGWVRMEGDNYIKVGPEAKSVRMAIVQPDHRFFSLLGSFSGLSPDNRNILLLKNVKISNSFKAIALMDRLYYSYAKFAGLEPMESPNKLQYLSTEVGTDMCAMGALDVCSKGEFFKAVPVFLRENRVKSVDDLLSMRTNFGRYRRMIKFFDALIPGEKGDGKGELSVRAGVYMRALTAFFAMDEAKKNGSEIDPAMLKAAEKFIVASGHAENIPPY